MSENPLISIITPCYNAADYIGQTIESVQIQTYSNWEMIIVDDGSKDRSREVITKYLKDSRIKYIYQENGKQGKARNNAINNSKGEYLAFLDADDLWVENKLERQMNSIIGEDIDLVYSSGKIFNESWQVEEYRYQKCMNGKYEGKKMLDLLIEKNRIPILSVLVKAEKVKEVGCFSENPEVQNAEDYQLWLKLADHGCTFLGVDEDLYLYRVHDNQSTGEDTYAAQQAMSALFDARIKTISKEELMKKAEIVLNRYLIHEIDRGFDDRFNKLIEIYRDKLNQPFKFFKLRFWKLFGLKFFKKMGYRCLKINYE